MRGIRLWFYTFAALMLLSACSSDGRSPDRTPPSIALMGDNPQVLAVGVAYVELGATASDNRDGDISGSIVINSSSVDSSAPGEYTVTYNVSDAAGNAAISVNRTVIYEDQTPPDLTLVGENPQIIEAGTDYTELGASAIDNVDGDLTAAISVDASAVDAMVPGEYSVEYEVSDAAGNRSTISRIVRVEDTTPPVVTLLGDDPQIIIVGNPYSEQGASAIDDVEGDLSAAIVVDTGTLDVGVVGNYAVVYSVADSAGNTGMVTRTVRVENPPPPAAPAISVTGGTKQLIFSWDEAANADYYRLLENPDGHSGYSQVGEDIPEGTSTARIDIAVHLHDWANSLYILQACNPGGCTSSAERSAQDAMLEAIGYFKASNQPRWFGYAIAVSGDGSTLAVGSMFEDSSAIGINGDQSDRSVPGSGVVYLFRFDGSSWSQTDYIKASNTGQADGFGRSVALNFDGSTLAVGADGEDSGATGINGDQLDGSAGNSGAVYLFRFDEGSWQQQAYIKASNTDEDDLFGHAIALSADGNTLAAGAFWENGSATGVNGDDTDNSLTGAGAVYLFRFDGTAWSQQAYIKASNTGFGDNFGVSVDLSADGNTLAVGARFESSQATGINGDQDDRVPLRNYGAAYLFRFDGDDWYQQAYIKASNTGQSDRFGSSTALSADGNTLAVAAISEGSSATGINGNQGDNDLNGSGAVYLFRFDGVDWTQQAYIKASNTDFSDSFGIVDLSADGDKLAVGAPHEDSIASGIGGDQLDDHPLGNSGAVYQFEFDGATWQQTAYIKSPNPDSGERTAECELDPRPWLCEQPGDNFGAALSLSADGRTLAVGAPWEDSSALGVGGDQTDNSATDSGAAYIY